MNCVDPGCTTPVSSRALRCKPHSLARQRVLSKLWHREHPERVEQLRKSTGRLGRREATA